MSQKDATLLLIFSLSFIAKNQIEFAIFSSKYVYLTLEVKQGDQGHTKKRYTTLWAGLYATQTERWLKRSETVNEIH